MSHDIKFLQTYSFVKYAKSLRGNNTDLSMIFIVFANILQCKKCLCFHLFTGS